MFFLQALNFILIAVTPASYPSSAPTAPVAQVTAQEQASEVSIAVEQKRDEPVPVAANEEKQETEKQE